MNIKKTFKRLLKKKVFSMEDVIDPEIVNDPFAGWISDISRRREVRSIIEIGSSSGDGSTQAILNGIKGRSDLSDMIICCFELSPVRFENLEKNVSAFNVVHPYNLPSVASSEFPSEDEVEKFMVDCDGPLKSLPVQRVVGVVAGGY